MDYCYQTESSPTPFDSPDPTRQQEMNSSRSSAPPSSSSSAYDPSGTSSSSNASSSAFSSTYAISPNSFFDFKLPSACLLPPSDYPDQINTWSSTTDDKSQSDIPHDSTKPVNFAQVAPGVYRSSFPSSEHFPFLRTLNLRSVLTLVVDDYPQENRQFLEDEHIQFFQYGLNSTKDPSVVIHDDIVSSALAAILDERNHPMLIHCNKGKHRTGCVVGCLRKLQGWDQIAIFDEYRLYAKEKQREADQRYIREFEAPVFWADASEAHLPAWSRRLEGVES